MPGIFADNPEYALTPDDFALRANLFYGWPDFHDKSLHRFPRQHKNTAGTGIVTYDFTYPMMNDVMRIVKDMNPRILDQTFDNT